MTRLLDLAKLKKSSKLEELKIKSGEAAKIRLFTEESEKVTLHFGNTELLRGHYHCLGLDNRCPACLAGQKATESYLLPVYAINKDAIAILKISDNDNHTSLLPQIMGALMENTAESFQSIHRLDNFNFKVDNHPSTKHRLLGADKIADFLNQQKDGQVDLTSIYRRPTAEELMDLPEIKVVLQLKQEIEDNSV